MKLFNWINPLWIINTFFTMRLEPITATSALGAMLGAGGTAAANAAITGAGIGALGGAATGSDPLKGALIGGALGGGGSLLGLGGGAASAVDDVATTGANLADDAAQLSGVTAERLVFNPSTGTFLNPEYFALAESGMPLYTGAGNTLSQVGTGLGSLGSQINTGLNSLGGSTLEALKANPAQTAGLGLNIYDRMNQQPQTQALQLGIINPQESGQYQPILNTILQKRKPYSLLG